MMQLLFKPVKKHVLPSLVMRGLVCFILCCYGPLSPADTLVKNQANPTASIQSNNVKDALQTLRITTPKQRLSAIDFSLPTLNGQTLKLSDYHGKVVLLNFWASFCTPCLDEMPALEALWQAYRDQGFVVIAVAADRGSVDPVRDFVKAGNYSFLIPLDPEGIVRNQYEVRALPTTYLIGRDGRFVGRVLGAREWSGEWGRKLIEKLLRQSM